MLAIVHNPRWLKARRAAVACTIGVLVLTAVNTCAVAAPFDVSSAHVGTHDSIETQLEWSHSASHDTWTLPKLKAAVTLIPHRVELKLSDTYQLRDNRIGERQWGGGDVEFEIKGALVRQGVDAPVDVAVEPKLYFPTGDSRRGLGDGATRVGLPLMVARRFGRAQFTTELEYTHGFARLPDTLSGGLLGTWRMRPALLVGGEVFVQHDQVAGAPVDIDANLGIKWHPTAKWELDALAGRNLRRPQEKVKLVGEYRF